MTLGQVGTFSGVVGPITAGAIGFGRVFLGTTDARRLGCSTQGLSGVPLPVCRADDVPGDCLSW